MRLIIFCFLLPLLLGGCILDVVDELVAIHASASGKGVSSASFDASAYRNKFSVQGGADTLIATIWLSLTARNSDQAKRIAQNVTASWNSGAETGLALTFGGSDKELISLDNIFIQIPDSASVRIDGGDTPVSVSGMNGDVTIGASGSDISVETKGRISIETDAGDISGSTGLGGEVTTNSGSIDLSVSSKDFESINITQKSDSSSRDVKLHIASGAKIQFKLSTSNGRISLKYDNLSYKTDFIHFSDGDDYNNGSGKIVSIQINDGDITVTN